LKGILLISGHVGKGPLIKEKKKKPCEKANRPGKAVRRTEESFLKGLQKCGNGCQGKVDRQQ